MMKTIYCALTLLTGLAAAVPANAQSPTSLQGKALISVNAGAQPQQRDLSTSESFSLYGELATLTTSQPIRNGAIFEVSGGYGLWRDLAVMVGFSTFGRSSASSLVASIPDPVFFNRPKTVSSEATGLKHTERGVHLQVVWRIPVSDKIDVALSAGPSFIRVTQQTASATVLAGTQNITVAQATQTGNAKGVNAGFDGCFMFTPQYGVGLFVRYAGGSVDLPAASALKVGGFQTGLGLRLRF